MPISPPSVPPIRVEFITPEPLWYAQWDFWVSVGTILLAMMTGWLALETRRMRRGSDKAMGELAKHAENAAAAAKESAEVAKKSAEALTSQTDVMASALKVAERSAIASEKSAAAADQSATLALQSERAWVMLTKVQSSPNLVKLVFLVISEFVNSGRTPSSELQMSQDLKVVPGGLNVEPVYFPFGVGSSKGSLAAGEYCQLPNSIQLSPQEFAQVMNGAAIFYVYGIAKYKDVFGLPHETKWCLEFSPASKEFTYCSRFNGNS
jgi:hypothetical protein